MEMQTSIGGCTYFNLVKEWLRKPRDTTVGVTATQTFHSIFICATRAPGYQVDTWRWGGPLEDRNIAVLDGGQQHKSFRADNGIGVWVGTGAKMHI